MSSLTTISVASKTVLEGCFPRVELEVNHNFGTGRHIVADLSLPVVRRTLSKVGGNGPLRDLQAVAEFTISLVPSVSQVTEPVVPATGVASHVGAEDYVARLHDVPASGEDPETNTQSQAGDITATAAGDDMEEAVGQATKSFEEMRAGPSILSRGEDAAGQLGDIGGQITTVAELWQPLLDKVERFTKVVDQIAEVRHFACVPLLSLTLR